MTVYRTIGPLVNETFGNFVTVGGHLNNRHKENIQYIIVKRNNVLFEA